MGIYTIVTDWYEPEVSIAKNISDEYRMVSTADIDAMVDLSRKEKVDGVFTQYTDSNLPYCQQICEKLGFYFCANRYQLDQISNKENAKNLCIKHGIPVPEKYSVTNAFDEEELNAIKYPVLTKPVDNSGQRGISICNNEEELKEGFVIAEANSERKEVLVEQYLKGDYVVICFTIQEGKLYLSAMADKPVIPEKYSNGLVRLPMGYVLPSKYIDKFYEEEFEKFKKLVEFLDLKNGSLGVEAIVSDGKFYVFEMQYRLGGMKHHSFVLEENGFDIMKMHIQYALTGKFGDESIEGKNNPYFRNTYYLLNLLLKDGTICKIDGIEEMLEIPEVYNFLPMHKIGDSIEITGSVMQIFGKVNIKAGSREELKRVLDLINKNVHIYDENGDEMLLDLIM